MILLKYASNNSGGAWWLTDSDWQKLEDAGWKVNWVRDEPKEGWHRGDERGRYLGALATDAELVCENMEAGIESWQEAIDRDPDAQGCECCGAPHHFYSEALP